MLKQNFSNTFYNFYNINEFLLLIRKGAFPYDYMESLQKLKEHKLPAKKAILQFFRQLIY